MTRWTIALLLGTLVVVAVIISILGGW